MVASHDPGRLDWKVDFRVVGQFEIGPTG